MAPLLQFIQEKLDRAGAALVLVPGSAFFVRGVEIPEGLPEKELRGFAELTVENLSPFQIEQLHWGYWRHPESQRLLLFAAYRERLRHLGYDGLESAAHVFPSFLIGAQTETFGQPTIQWVLEGRCLSAVFFEANEPVPVLVRNHDLTELSAAAIQDAQELLRKNPPFTAETFREESPVTGGLHRLQADQSVEFALFDGFAGVEPVPSSADDAPAEELTEAPLNRRPDTTLPFAATRIDCWAADIHDTALVRKLQQNRNLSARLWWVYFGAAAAAVLLLLGELAILGGGFWLKQMQQTIGAQAPQVARIQSDDSLLRVLQQAETEGLRPFHMLASVNTVRPPPIYFTDIWTDEENPNSIRIEGLARDVTMANRFADRVNSLPQVSDAALDPSGSGAQGAEFSLFVEFLAGSFEPKPEPASEPALEGSPESPEEPAPGEPAIARNDP